MNMTTKTLLAALTAVPLIAGSADAAVIASTGTVIASWDTYGHTTGAGTQSGDVTQTDGLQISGWVGAWDTMPVNVGNSERVGTSNGYTFRWNVGGAAWGGAWTGATSPADTMRNDYYYTDSDHPSYLGAIDWRIEGLTAGTAYDLVFYGNGSNRGDAEFAIAGYNSGNPVTRDAEGDGNFMSVVADINGHISGTFDVAPGATGAKEALMNGLQVAEVPEPGSLALLGLGGLCMMRRRRG